MNQENSNCRALYIRTPRCGSAALTDLFSKHKILSIGGRNVGFWGTNPDWGLYKTQFQRMKFALYGKHTLSSRIELILGEEAFRNTFKIASVRNPYARAVSIWRHKSWSSCNSFKEFVNALYKKKYPSKCAGWHSVILSDHIFVDGPVAISKIIKLETIEKDLSDIGQELNIQNLEYEIAETDRSSLQDINQSKKYYEYYTPETANLVKEIFYKDFEIFGYPTELEQGDS